MCVSWHAAWIILAVNATTAATIPEALRLNVVTQSADVVRHGNQLNFPSSHLNSPATEVGYEVTLEVTAASPPVRLRYRSHGCGETLDLATGLAVLGCQASSRQGSDSAELSLDSHRPGTGFSQTRLTLDTPDLAACLLPQCASERALVVSLQSNSGNHALRIVSDVPIRIEHADMRFEIGAGALELTSSERGGGAFRADQRAVVSIKGAVAYRNGRLWGALAADRWQVGVDAAGASNDGTELDMTLLLPHGSVNWIEEDGIYRRADEPALQARLDAVAPDPTYAGQDSLWTEAQSVAERAFKSTVRFLRPAGELVELKRQHADLAAGATLMRMGFSRRLPQDAVAAATPDVELAIVTLDPARARLELRSPCDPEGALATINGYAYRHTGVPGELLPDAGLMLHGQVLGRIKTHPWYVNLLIDKTGDVRLENARHFFDRQGVRGDLDALLQGAIYLQGGRNHRQPNDNPEVNWRSALALGTVDGAPRIFLVHTLLPTTALGAATAYGRGLTQFEMAEQLRALGATDALVLDGGPSAALTIPGVLASGGVRPVPLCVAAVRR